MLEPFCNVPLVFDVVSSIQRLILGNLLTVWTRVDLDIGCYRVQRKEREKTEAETQ